MKLLADYYVAQFAEGQFRVIDKHFRSKRNAEFSPNHQHQLHIIQTVQTKLLQRHICRQPRYLPLWLHATCRKSFHITDDTFPYALPLFIVITKYQRRIGTAKTEAEAHDMTQTTVPMPFANIIEITFGIGGVQMAGCRHHLLL